jgi:hypothetical protein
VRSRVVRRQRQEGGLKRLAASLVGAVHRAQEEVPPAVVAGGRPSQEGGAPMGLMGKGHPRQEVVVPMGLEKEGATCCGEEKT